MAPLGERGGGRWRPAQMLQMLAGFQISQALYVVAKLGLADGPRTIEQLAAATGFTIERIVPSPTPFSFIEATLEVSA
jgi:hypothetical protein